MKECYNCLNAIGGCEIKNCTLYSKWKEIPDWENYKKTFKTVTDNDKTPKLINVIEL